MIESEEYVKTSFGDVLVNIYGNRKKHPIVTFHDIGLNAQDNFHNFFVDDTADLFGTGFCIYNINAPGQEISALEFDDNYHFPTISETVGLIDEIVKHFNFKSFVGLGVGAGAHLMLRYAVENQDKLDGLILINCVETKVGWLEWAQEKLNVELLRDFGMTKFTENYLLWHHLGQRLYDCSKSELTNFRLYFETRPNLKNVAAFIDSYLDRSDIDIKGWDNIFEEPFLVPVLQIVGDRSAFVKDAEFLHSQLQPKTAEFLKLENCGGDVLDEKPGKVAQAILLFLQGIGFVSWINVHDAVKNLVKTEGKFKKDVFMEDPVKSDVKVEDESKTTENVPMVDDGLLGNTIMF